MDAIWPVIIGALILLACSFGCVVMGAAVWAFARVRGEKREFSSACMSGSCSHDEHAEGRGATST